MRKETFDTMNGLRGIAAFIIVIWHGGSDWFGLLRPSGAYLAVDLFFVLSGFVIAHSYQSRLASGMTVSQFFIVRMIRLYPLYILGTLIACVAMVLSFISEESNFKTEMTGIISLLFAFAMLPKPSIHSLSFLYPLNVSAWSLLMEIIINLLFAISYKYWSIRNICMIMILSSVLMLSNDYFTTTAEWGSGGFDWGSFPFGLLRVLYSFPAGVLIYRMIHERKLPFPRMNCFAIFFLLPFLLVCNSGWPCKLSMLIGMPLLVASAAKSQPRGKVRWICAILGSASYAIYAIHVPLIGLTRLIVERCGLDSHSQIVGYTLILTILPLCLLIDKWYDMPTRRFLSNVSFRIFRNSKTKIQVTT